MAKKSKKIPRLSGWKTKTIYRDAHGRYTSKDQAFRWEEWKYRVDARNRIHDLKVKGNTVQSEEKLHFPTVPIAGKGKRAGKISAQIGETMRTIGSKRHASTITVTMMARTYHGKLVRRKISWDTYHMGNKLIDSSSGIIMKQLFYAHGDRPAYPVEIVKGWRKRGVTKKETEKRRQLYDVRIHVESELL